MLVAGGRDGGTSGSGQSGHGKRCARRARATRPGLPGSRLPARLPRSAPGRRTGRAVPAAPRVPSPVTTCLQQIGDGFRRSVASFADANHIPVVRLKSTDRNIDVMRRYLDSAARQGRSQVAAIGVAQEPQRVFISRQRDTDPSKPPQFSFDKKDRRVTVYYFYLYDADFGPAFIKVCTYCPWPIKVWVNGHEWAKQQAARTGIGFTELSNGFAATDDSAALQAICDRLGPGTINVL